MTKEEIIEQQNAYYLAGHPSRRSENQKPTYEELEKKNADLELKIKKLTQHLEPQSMSALFEQVEEEVKQEQKIKELKDRNAELARQKASLERWFGEAKRIIGEFMRISVASVEEFEPEFTELIEQAESFLKEKN